MKKILIGVLLSLAVTTIYSDEISEALISAKDAYDHKKYSESSLFIHKALGGIRRIISSQIMNYLPGELEGWERTHPTSNVDTGESIGIVSTQNYSVEVRFTQKEQNQQVTVTISNIAHIVQIAKAGIELYKNPFFQKMQQERQTEEKIETLTVKDFEGAKTTNTKSKRHEIVLFYQDLMMQMRGSGIADPATLDAFLNAIDFDGLKNFSGEIRQGQEKPIEKT